MGVSLQALNLLVQIRFLALSLQASHLLQHVTYKDGIVFASNVPVRTNALVWGFHPLRPRINIALLGLEKLQASRCVPAPELHSGVSVNLLRGE